MVKVSTYISKETGKATIYGTSADDKTKIRAYHNGDKFIEMDTGDTFLYSKADKAFVKLGNAQGGSETLEPKSVFTSKENGRQEIFGLEKDKNNLKNLHNGALFTALDSGKYYIYSKRTKEFLPWHDESGVSPTPTPTPTTQTGYPLSDVPAWNTETHMFASSNPDIYLPSIPDKITTSLEYRFLSPAILDSETESGGCGFIFHAPENAYFCYDETGSEIGGQAYFNTLTEWNVYEFSFLVVDKSETHPETGAPIYAIIVIMKDLGPCAYDYHME